MSPQAHIVTATRLLGEGKYDAAIAELEGSSLWDREQRLAAADLRMRAWVAVDPYADDAAAAHREVIEAADLADVSDLRRRLGYRRAFAQYLVVKGRSDEAERVALEALALVSIEHTDDYGLLNVIAMHTTRAGAWALPFARRAVEVADQQGRHGLGLAARLAVARHLWMSGRREEAEQHFEALLAFAQQHNGHLEMALHSIAEIRSAAR